MLVTDFVESLTDIFGDADNVVDMLCVVFLVLMVLVFNVDFSVGFFFFVEGGFVLNVEVTVGDVLLDLL